MAQQLSTNTFGTAKWIVSATVTDGTHTTIGAALTSASSGDTIFIRPGTYTENPTLKAGVNLSAYSCDGFDGQVIISGKCSYSGTGAVSISGIQLQTNSDYALEVTGSNASTVLLEQCNVVNTNNTAIHFTSSNASSAIFLNYCFTAVGATNSLFASTAAGAINLFWCLMSSSSSTASTSSGAGGIQMSHCGSSEPLSLSGTGNFIIYHTQIRTFSGNRTCLTTANTANGIISNSYFESGTASAISVGSTSVSITNSTISSSNTNVITGAGTVSYSGLQFSSTSSTINTTTQTLLASGPSVVQGSSNSGNTNTLTVINTSNTATSSANIISSVAGATAADPTHQSVVSGVTTWTWGADNSVTSPTDDPWVLAQGTALGTNNAISVNKNGVINYPLQPAFLAIATAQSNVTGDGTLYTVTFNTEIFDQGNNFDAVSTFTAPVTGRYLFEVNVTYTGIGAANLNTNQVVLAATSRSIGLNPGNLTAQKDTAFSVFGVSLSSIIDMTAADTAKVMAEASGGTKSVGIQQTNSTFSGSLVA